MPLALTVFGVAMDGLSPIFCYASIRTVRGVGSYPTPNLPKHIANVGIFRSTIPDTEFELITWDKIIPQSEEVEFQNAISEGCLTVPDECPIAAGETIKGVHFGPVIVDEKNQRAHISGVGILYRRGIATEMPFYTLKEILDKKLKPGTVCKALENLIAQISALSSIPELFKLHRPLGCVDYFYRSPAIEYQDGRLFDVVGDKPDFRTKDPMLRVFVRRCAAPLNKKFSLHISLGNYDHVIRSVLLEIQNGISDITVSTLKHITDVSIDVFDDAGDLVEKLNFKFNQGFQFSLSALGPADLLPPPFPGAPKSPDLEVRKRVHTASFEGPSVSGRSGGFDILRKNANDLSALVGPISTTSENVWFERGLAGQLEVIRWIKKKIEQPGLTKTYLADPYLGSNSLKRVISRQGNESAELVVVVSPGNIDPDSDNVATKSGTEYLAKLVNTATEWAANLAGKVSVIHVKRGDGSRQAFHDRYICTVNQKGVPNVYLLSNSLSKAAGDWPFAICELNQVMSWRVYASILEMIEGEVDGLFPEVIWNSDDVSVVHQSNTTKSFGISDSENDRTLQANTFLKDIWNIIIRNSEFKSQVGARIDALLRAWPENVDLEKFADALFKVAYHRDAIVVFISDHLRNRGSKDFANMLDSRLLDKTLEILPDEGQLSGWFLSFDVRRPVLENLGKTIARKQNSTNFVLAKLNPKVHGLITLVETQRFGHRITWEAYETALFLSIMALEAAAQSDAPQRHRIGVAIDYIHWLGRLMRSDAAAGMYVSNDNVPTQYLDDVYFAAQTVAKARYILGDALDTPIDSVKDDPWVVPIFKEKLLFCLSSFT